MALFEYFFENPVVSSNGSIEKMEDFETLLAGSAQAHGHLCPGQVIGVRMAMLGCELISLDNPSQPSQIKSLIVYVEIDRCATDAIAYVTGVKLGRRSLKYIDNGIMAATFVNLDTQTAFRILSRETSRDEAKLYAPGIENKREQQLEAYKIMPLDALFEIQAVDVDIPYHDMPGPTRFKSECQVCGVIVRDKKEVFLNGKMMCRNCAGRPYFRKQ